MCPSTVLQPSTPLPLPLPLSPFPPSLSSLQYIGSLQKKHNIGSFDLLRQTSPLQAASLFAVGPFFDYFNSGRNVLDFQPTTMAVVSVCRPCATEG